MADETKKPKATLIKHKRDEASHAARTDESQDKKKVRVVVKKKAAPKFVVKKEAATGNREEPTRSEPSPRTEPSPHAEQSSRPQTSRENGHPGSAETPQRGGTASGRTEPADARREPAARASAGGPTGARAEHPRAGDQPESREKEGAAPRGEAREAAPSARERAGGRADGTARDRGDQQAQERPGQRTPQSKGQPTGNDATQEDRPVWTPEGNKLQRPAGARRGPGSLPESVRERARTTDDRGVRPTRPDYQARRTGDARPGGGPRQFDGPRENRPGGPPRPAFRGPGRPGGFRPGGPPRTSEPATTDDKKPGPKKFYKAKKKDSYQKREKHQEKMIQLKQKKSMPKANPVPKQIDIMEVITVSELARKMNLKASDLIGKLMSMGMMVTINQQIDADTAAILANEYDCKVNIVSLYDETIIETSTDSETDLAPRPPIVTVMGHVDHGKTKLLDAIRSADVVAGEFGGITQHIGAYQVELPQGRITFLDTPGHEAFTLMRARGAQITDIVILVVAADDGVMPQTIEAINHAKEAKVPIVVAINKVDLPDANPDRVKQQLSDYALVPEAWGGQTLYAEVSALKKQGIDGLLEQVLLQAEMLELRANFDAAAEGKIIESRVDQGRGTVATVLIERGTLHVGDSFIGGVFPGRVRAMFNDRGDRVNEAGPAMPVEVLGFTGVPNAGDPFQVTENEKIARQVGDKRQELRKVEEAKNVKKITLDNLYDSIQEGAVQELKVIIKGDVHGSVEALQNALERLSTNEVKLNAIQSMTGSINENDVMLAAASNAIILGFHVRPSARAQQIADREKVEIRKYNIIYDAVEDVRSAMEGMLAPELREEVVGTVEVRETFKVPKIGLIAGSYVTDGKVRRGASIRVIRDGVQIGEGKVSSLKRFKDDAREVDAGYECGIGIDTFNDLRVGDQLEVFEVREIAKKLETVRSEERANG